MQKNMQYWIQELLIAARLARQDRQDKLKLSTRLVANKSKLLKPAVKLQFLYMLIMKIKDNLLILHHLTWTYHNLMVKNFSDGFIKSHNI